MPKPETSRPSQIVASAAAMLACGWLASASAFAEEPAAVPDSEAVCTHVASLSDARGGTATAEEMAECKDAMASLRAICGDAWDAAARCIVDADTEDAAMVCIEPCFQNAARGVTGSPEPTPVPVAPEITSACTVMVSLTDGAGEQADCEASLQMAVESCPTVASETLKCLESASDEDALGACLAACAKARDPR